MLPLNLIEDAVNAFMDVWQRSRSLRDPFYGSRLSEIPYTCPPFEVCKIGLSGKSTGPYEENVTTWATPVSADICYLRGYKISRGVNVIPIHHPDPTLKLDR